MGFAGDGGLQIVTGSADGQAGGRITYGLEILEVAVSVSRLTFGGGAKHGGHVVVAFTSALLAKYR